ncbi:MAG: DUF2130 domain-containing protein [Planctomycetaceae bacterium]|nr:DUF2130 domain-containing protein [Planctomycetaceae bacterium]
MTPYTKITCPTCNSTLDVEEVLGNRIEEKYQKQYQTKIAELVQKESEIDKQIAEKTRAELARREKEITKQTEDKFKSQYEVQLRSQSEETAELKKQLHESKNAQIENERLKRQLESQKQNFELEFEKKLSLQLKDEVELVAKREAQRHESLIQELKKQLEDQRNLAEEMKRKAEQGSQQLQGEVQELMIEEFLQTTFPSDTIEEIGKGKTGADVKQFVRNRFGTEIGIIIYESKNTKDFNHAWIEKLKSDAERENADVSVLVTRTMPKNLEHLGLLDGVWVCSVTELKGLVVALRESLIRLGEVRTSQTNKGEKMQMLYDYLTDGKFVEQIKRVVSGFTTLREGYQKEKEAMQKIWKKRDEQLEMMLRNTTDFVTQIQTIAGSSIPQLEAPEDELLALG